MKADEVGRITFNYWNCSYSSAVDCGSNRLVGRGECRGASPTKTNSVHILFKNTKTKMFMIIYYLDTNIMLFWNRKKG